MRRQTLATITAGLLFGAILTTASGAFADQRTEAKSHFKRGMGLISDGKYEEGISELQRAYEILPHPNVLYNIARAYAESGDLEGAVANYKKYLEGNPADRDEVAQITANLEGRIRRQQAVAAAASQAATPTTTPGTTPGTTTPGTTPGTTPTTPGTTPGTTTTPGAVAQNPETPGVAAANKVDVGQAKTEDVFEETVVTASKGAQSPLDAPNSTSIITEQDIRLSGIIKIPELLRRLAGVDILEDTGSQSEVSLRGFNQRLSNKVLVLVNGRSVFIDLLGVTLWGTLSIGVEDVERIEVVRGPGSALYGADAFNGVINIITKAPGEGKSGFNVGAGDHGTTHGSIWATGRDKETAWRAAAGYDSIPKWSREVADNRQDVKFNNAEFGSQDLSQRTTRLDLRVTRDLGKGVTAGIGGGLEQGTFEILGQGPINDIQLNQQFSDVTAFINSKHLEFRAFWNNFRGRHSLVAEPIGQSLIVAQFDANVVDSELQYINQFETGKGINHDLHLGLGYRFKQDRWSYQAADHIEHHESVYIHDEIKFGEKFAIVGDLRLDYVPYLQTITPSPRGTIIFHPSKGSSIRGIIATAFRTPTFLEAYLGLPVQLPFAGGSLAASTVPPDRPNAKLKAEQILTGELGYLNQESDYFTFDSAVFYNHAKNLIQLSPNRALTVGDLSNSASNFDPTSGLYPLFYGGWENQCQSYNVLGGEFGVRTFPTDGLDIYANYTLMSVKQDKTDCSAEQTALIPYEAQTSTHKLNAGIQLRTKPGLDGSIDFHYVSPQDWAELVTNIAVQRVEYQTFHLPAYTLLNARIGYRFLRNQADISATAFNLLGIEHREHPFGQIIGRRTMGFFTYRF